MTGVLLEAKGRPNGRRALQAEMVRVWAALDALDDASARRIVAAVAELRGSILERVAALAVTTLDDVETFQATALRAFAAELEEVAARFAVRAELALGEDVRAAAALADEAHRAALAALARARGVPPALITLGPLGVADTQVAAAVLFQDSAIRNVSQTVVQAVNREIQAVVFGAQARWDAVRNIRAALATTGKDLGTLTNRALTIERTALISVFNIAADHAYRQALDELPDLQVEWITARDKRVDPVCVGLNGKRKHPRGTFPGGLIAPPAHPRCRCRTVAWLPDWGGT